MSWGYVLRRILLTIPAVFGILTISFGLVYLVPGSPAHTLAGENADAARIAQIEDQYGLNKSLPAQYGTYVADVFQGDLGYSFTHGKPVTEVIRERLWPTALLAGSAMLVSTLIGIAVGVVVARRPYGPLDAGASFGVLLVL